MEHRNRNESKKEKKKKRKTETNNVYRGSKRMTQAFSSICKSHSTIHDRKKKKRKKLSNAATSKKKTSKFTIAIENFSREYLTF